MREGGASVEAFVRTRNPIDVIVASGHAGINALLKRGCGDDSGPSARTGFSLDSGPRTSLARAEAHHMIQ